MVSFIVTRIRNRHMVSLARMATTVWRRLRWPRRLIVAVLLLTGAVSLWSLLRTPALRIGHPPPPGDQAQLSSALAPGGAGVVVPELSSASLARLDLRPGYRRPEADTFLQHPQWYVVYGSEEYGRHLARRLPSSFPYAAAIGQFWRAYRETWSQTRDAYPASWSSHLLLWLIGTGYATELSLKGLYEHTIGRLSEWSAGGELTPEDRLAAEVAQEYGRFLHQQPWYEYRFAPRILAAWLELPAWGRHPARSWERKGFLTLEYGVKAVSAGVATMAARATRQRRSSRTELLVRGWSDSLQRALPELPVEDWIDSAAAVVSTGRFDPTRDALLHLALNAPANVRIDAIAGRSVTAFTGVAPRDWSPPGGGGRVLYALPLPTDSTRVRLLFQARTRDLLTWLRRLTPDSALTIDRVYD